MQFENSKNLVHFVNKNSLMYDFDSIGFEPKMLGTR